MPLQPLSFRPGINREQTNYTNEGGWYDCDKIRFRSGQPEKIGGWTQVVPDHEYLGVARSIFDWVDLENNNLIALGTNLKYYVLQGTYHDITPLRRSVTLDPDPFQATAGLSTLIVTDVNNGSLVGDFVTFSGATAFDNYTEADLNKEYRITAVLSSDTYLIDTGVVAGADGSGGGSVVEAKYQIHTGLAVYTLGSGWGAGVWNAAQVSPLVGTTLAYTAPYTTGQILLNDTATTINVASTTGFPSVGALLINSELITYSGKTSTSFTGCVRGATIGDAESLATYHSLAATTNPDPIPVQLVLYLNGTTAWNGPTTGVNSGTQLRLWTQDNYGEWLLYAYRGGPIYLWPDYTTTFAPGLLLSDAADNEGFDGAAVPATTNQVLVSDVSRFVIAIGSTAYGDLSYTFDPMLVRWSDMENLYQWVPDITNQAGERRLTNGSFLMCALKMRQENLIWSDTALYSMQYIGPPNAWGFTLLADNLSIISPNAAATTRNMAFWMGRDKFYMYSGQVQTLPCTVRKYIFQDLAQQQAFQVVSGTNEAFSEIWWYYVSNTEVENATLENRDPIVDKYVIYNHLDNLWYYGSLSRTAWLNTGLQAYPLAAYGDSVSGRLLFHEFGVDDQSTSEPAPIAAYIQSSDFDIGSGDHFSFVWRMIPDVSFAGSVGAATGGSAYPQVTVSLQTRHGTGAPYQYPVDTDDVVSTQRYSQLQKSYTVEQYTQQVYTRVRGRQLAFRIDSDKLGVTWQLGTFRIDTRPDGRR